MVPLDYTFFTLLKQLVVEGKVSEKRIDESVRRILQLSGLGLFKNPYVEPETVGQFGKPEYHQVAVAAAGRSNHVAQERRGTLPLAKSAKILAGPGEKYQHIAWLLVFHRQGLMRRFIPRVL